MIFDGHKSHAKSSEHIDYARKNGLFLLSLPLHTTHKLQQKVFTRIQREPVNNER